MNEALVTNRRSVRWGSKRSWIIVLVGATLILTAPCWGLLIYTAVSRRSIEERVDSKSVPFDSSRWKSWENAKSDLRLSMLRDLTDNEPIVGRTKDETTRILGKPAFVWQGEREGTEYWYQLGKAWADPDDAVSYSRFGCWGFPWLVVRFNGDRAVRMYQSMSGADVSPTHVLQDASQHRQR